MRLGVNTVLFGEHDLSKVAKYIKFSGYEGIELASIVGMAEHVSDTTSANELRNIKKIVEEAELELYCIEAATDILNNENRERTKRIFEQASKLGIPMVTTGSSGISDDEQKVKESTQAIEELAQAAKDTGVQYALKMHYGQSIYNTQTAQRLVQEVKNPALGLNFDATHIGRVGDDPIAAIDSLQNHIVHVHIRDTLIEKMKISPPEYQIAGRGTVPLKEVIKKLIELNYTGAAVLEIIGAKGYELPQLTAIAAESRGYLTCLIEELETRKSGV